ncbi:MAG: 16S rRNA (cytosine(967)-C(5))-methyltransferase RsmB [Gallionellaceae bacterium]|nr:MAG: 16S rRNA (cytosine(967)-C(5))-methyltransferase RsmB [Gallionellaceae bacterium]
MHIVQQLAAGIVGQVLTGRNLNQTLEEVLRKHAAFSAQERGALQDICYGTLRYYGQLGKMLDALLGKPLQDQRLRELLLVALYQLQYSKAASHAVVDHAVRAAKKMNAAASGLVNAVLRNFLRRQSELLQLAAKTDEGRYSYPQWWIDAIKSQYGEQAESILEAGNQHPPMTLRANLRQSSTEQYLAQLQAQGIAARLVAPQALWLEQPLPVDRLPGFLDGAVSVQDAGAQYAAMLLDVEDGMRVLDACAAPGGKTAHLLEMRNIEMVAADKDARRLERVRENLQRLKLGATLLCGDAAEPANWWDGKTFDRILADVPCSASGVVRRHPDIKWLRRPSDIESFAKQQARILQALWPLLAGNGKLLYATCSVFARENQQVIDVFLSRHNDAKQTIITAHDLYNGQLLPNDQHDGFFYALLQKNA